MTTTSHLLSLLVLASIAACGGKARTEPTPPVAKTAPAAEPAPATTSVGAALVAEIDAWDQTVVIGAAEPGHGLGGMQMTVAGKPVWPPQGPSCEAYVACCEGIAGGDDGARALQLSCQLAVAKRPECDTALDTVRAIASETGQALPASCPAS